jgi:hypothetical protein
VIPTTPASEHVRFCHLRTDYFDHVATDVDRLVEGERMAEQRRPPGTLIPSLGDRVYASYVHTIVCPREKRCPQRRQPSWPVGGCVTLGCFDSFSRGSPT